MRKASLLTLTSLILVAASMLFVDIAMAQPYYTPGAPAKLKIKLPDGSQFMNVTPPTYDIGDKFNITVSVENVTQMTALGLTIVWNATFCNATGNYWPSPWLKSKIMAAEWSALKDEYWTNDYDQDQHGGMMGVPLMGVLAGLSTKAFGVGYAVDGDYDIAIIEFQINAYGPNWFYVWKDAGTRESQILQMYHPTYSGWQSPTGTPPTYQMPYDVVWASGYTDVANAVLYVNAPPVIPIIESCDSTGVITDQFNLSETVYVNGSGYSPSTTYDIYIVNDETSWSDGMTIPTRVSGTIPTVSSNPTGDIPPTAVWSPDLTLGEYDIVVDVNNNSKYDVDIDALDDMDIEETAGFSVIPEFPSLIILPLFLTATIIAVVVAKTVWSKRPRGRIDVK